MAKLFEGLRAQRLPIPWGSLRAAGKDLARPTLPPGDLDSLDDLEKASRMALVRRSAALGPIFTGTMHGELCICIMGLPLGRRFLQEHAESLRPHTLELEPLIPLGFLRQMSGDDHRDYRRALVRAARSLDQIVDQAILDVICTSGLRDLELRLDDNASGPSPLLDVASEIATAALIVLFFGALPGSEPFARLVAAYRRLGPFGLVWNLQAQQHQAFADLRDDLRMQLRERKAGSAAMADACVLVQLANEGPVDETMLGNLIYMVEMGRQDIQAFFRWLLRYGAANPGAMARIAQEDAAAQSASHRSEHAESGEHAEHSEPADLSSAEAFVLEVLRSDQSERLVRRATRDIVFENYLIPKDAFVRICVWEAHHSDDVFADPYRFDPARFLRSTPTKEQFSPFGIDHHQCPFGGLSIRLGTSLLRAAASFELTTLEDAAPTRAAYHWEPSRKLRVRVRSR
jgi:cytochrome P450